MQQEFYPPPLQYQYHLQPPIPLQQQLHQDNEINVLDNTKVKLPYFVEEYADLWFWQVEAAFDAARISADKKKYNTIIGQLPTRVMYKLADLRSNPPVLGHMYETLKKRILEEFADTTQAKITQLLGTLSLGDRKPSQLLAEMRAKAANTPVQDDLLKELWQRNLPEQVRAIVSSNDLTLSQAATMADRVAEALRPRSINSVSPLLPDQNENNICQLSQIQQQVNQILRRLQSDQHGEHRRSRSHHRANSDREKTPRRYQGPQEDKKRIFEYCWWHHKYGVEARRCRSPCNFKKCHQTDGQIKHGCYQNSSDQNPKN